MTFPQRLARPCRRLCKTLQFPPHRPERAAWVRRWRDTRPEEIPENLMWSFFGVLVGNLIGVLPAPLIGLWVRVLRLPYRYLFPSALFFIAVGVFSTNNSLFEVGEVLVFGVAGAVFVERPISGVFIALAALLVLVQIFFAMRKATCRSSTTRRRCSTSEESTAP